MIVRGLRVGLALLGALWAILSLLALLTSTALPDLAGVVAGTLLAALAWPRKHKHNHRA